MFITFWLGFAVAGILALIALGLLVMKAMFFFTTTK